MGMLKGQIVFQIKSMRPKGETRSQSLENKVICSLTSDLLPTKAGNAQGGWASVIRSCILKFPLHNLLGGP